MKRAWFIIALILLVAGVIFEERHRAETIKNHLPPVPLKDPAATPFAVPESHFADRVDLWGNPWATPAAPDLASVAFQKNLRPATVENFQSKQNYSSEPVLTVQDREVSYALFEAGGFTLKLNLKPVYPNAEAWLPTSVGAGLGGSLSF